MKQCQECVPIRLSPADYNCKFDDRAKRVRKSNTTAPRCYKWGIYMRRWKRAKEFAESLYRVGNGGKKWALIIHDVRLFLVEVW